ncbi:MAG: 2-hydroxychromene-2-carboxylate isomerase [Thermomonas haemolytica]
MHVEATWYFDVVSPYAYLQWRRLQRLGIEGLLLRPVLFAALLDHAGHKGPAEIPAKRCFTYRQVAWRASRDGIALVFPPAHPFNPLPALRLCVAAGATADVVDAVFRWIWEEGRAAQYPDEIAGLARRIGIVDAPAALAQPWVKQALRENLAHALRDEVFGVPTLVCRGELFWGDDATPMFVDYLRDPGWLHSAGMQRLARLPVAAVRPGALHGPASDRR